MLEMVLEMVVEMREERGRGERKKGIRRRVGGGSREEGSERSEGRPESFHTRG